MRLARKAPVANRRIERYGFPVKNQLPVRRAQRRHDLFAASAAALVSYGSERHRDIKRPVLQFVVIVGTVKKSMAAMAYGNTNHSQLL